MSNINILIVDDNKNNLLSLRSLIEEYITDVAIFEADSGLNALSFLMKNDVSLILLDIQMPQMDGFETAKMIQSRSKTKHVPIVFLTAAYKSDDFRKKGFAVGAADYLTKPIEPTHLINKLKTYLRFIEQGQQPTNKQAIHVETTKVSEANESLQEVMDELQTSLSVIINSSQILEKEAQDSFQKNGLSEIEKISHVSQKLLALVKDVLEPKILRELCILMSNK